jgi:hypothetical protein
MTSIPPHDRPVPSGKQTGEPHSTGGPASHLGWGFEESPAPFPTAPPAPRANRLGLAALICGLSACIPFWTGPLIWVFILCTIAAIGLGIAGLLVKDRGRRAAAAGIILGILAIPLQFLWIFVTALVTGAI